MVLIYVSEVAHIARPAPERKTQMDKTLDIIKTEAEIAKLMAETQKLNLESRWMPFVWASGLILAVMTITKFLFN
jgi:predicted nicotinamide N-methyase